MANKSILYKYFKNIKIHLDLEIKWDFLAFPPRCPRSFVKSNFAMIHCFIQVIKTRFLNKKRLSYIFSSSIVEKIFTERKHIFDLQISGFNKCFSTKNIYKSGCGHSFNCERFCCSKCFIKLNWYLWTCSLEYITVCLPLSSSSSSSFKMFKVETSEPFKRWTKFECSELESK